MTTTVAGASEAHARGEAAAARWRALASPGVFLGAAMLVAGALDYAVSVLAGRWLGPTEFGSFVSVTALLQVLLSVATAIRMVVALHAAELTARDDAAAGLGAFLRGASRWCWRRGLAAAALAALAAPALAPALRLASPGPLWAASAMVLMLFPREATLGALQGIQAFTGLGIVQASQAVLRLGLAAALMLLGARATGAIAAQPLAAVGGIALGLRWLRPYLVRRDAPAPRLAVSASYSLATVVGLSAFGLLTNLDALVVKLLFAPRVAGDYGAVITFERVSLFLPWAVSFVLFPKAAQRHAQGRDARPILVRALAAALLPGLLLSALYLLAPGPIVRRVFTADYADPGVVLGLASLAATLYAGVNIWLNYALSSRRRGFVPGLACVVALQAAAMVAVAQRGLAAIAVTMVVGGALANAVGYVTTWRPPRSRAPLGGPAGRRAGEAT